MKQTDVYVTLRGEKITLNGLDSEERRLLGRLRRRAAMEPSWTDFGNYWTHEVAGFYDARGVARTHSLRSPVYRIAQDLCSRLGVAAGLLRAPDYRDELEQLIGQRFPSRRAFCKATGLSEDMLSHVLARRKDLSLTRLTQALERIGYRLRIAPGPPPTSVKHAPNARKSSARPA